MTSPEKHKRFFTVFFPYVLAGAVALGLKTHYSLAASDDLFWIMSPTAGLVSRLSGLAFVPDATAGFVNGDLGIAIAPACSGVNFLIVAFCMAFFSFAHRYPRGFDQYFWVALSLAGAYVMTLAANSLRICLSIVTISHEIHIGWLTSERIHRMEGIVIYFLFLLLFYQGLHYVTSFQHGGRPRIGRLNRPVSWPVFWYLAMAIGVPFFTGNFRNDPRRFFEHGMTVLLICAGMVAIFKGLRSISR